MSDKTLTLEDIQGIRPVCRLKKHFVDVLDAWVWIKALNAQETIDYEAFTADVTDNDQYSDTEEGVRLMSKLLSLCVVDENGKSLFSPEWFQACDTDFIVRLHSVVKRHNGFDQESEDDIEKNSSGDQD